MATAKRDENRIPTLMGVSSTDSITPVVIEADATTKGLNVQIVGDDVGIGGGTQYTTNAVAPDPATGNAAMMERDDVITTLTPVEGDWVRQRATAEGALWTQDFNSDAILSDTSSIDGKITACDTGSVTVSASLPAGTNAIGKLAANSGVDIGDVDVTSISSGSINGPGEPTIDSYTQFAINLNAGTNQVLVSSALNKQIWVYGFGFTLSVAGTVSFQDEDDVAITGIMDFAANSGMSQNPSGSFSMPIWKLGTNKDLEVDIVTAAVDGWISYAIVSV